MHGAGIFAMDVVRTQGWQPIRMAPSSASKAAGSRATPSHLGGAAGEARRRPITRPCACCSNRWTARYGRNYPKQSKPCISSVKPSKAVSGTKIIRFKKLRDYVLLVLKLRDHFYTLDIVEGRKIYLSQNKINQRRA